MSQPIPVSSEPLALDDNRCTSQSDSTSTSMGTSMQFSTSESQDLSESQDGEVFRRAFSEGDNPRPIFYMGEDKVPMPFDQDAKVCGEERKIVMGICAMAKKTRSKPMKEICDRLKKFEHISILFFDQDVILNEPVENWPIVDALVSFFSTGFPLDKAIQYKNLRKPFIVNDLEAQYALQDRREVYKILVREGIMHPRYAVLDREESETTDSTIVETEDSIEVNGCMFQKPFVEKPVSAEDHNVYIYFPVAAGGGSQRLFRKVASRSSVYSPVSRVRKTGSYIYEEFMPTDGTDVKVYTVGPDYAHAEARKSPALDGKVERDRSGKEVRYPVLLSAKEKLIARKVCLAFKQNVCGFDLLRASGQSYVCDVNGFSFVKNSSKYYDDCAKIIGTMIMRALAPQLHIPWVLGSAPEDIPVVPTTSGSMMELRCVTAVMRHGDRTPKQKMKMEVKNQKFFDLFEKYDGYKKGHLKLKKPKQLQEVLDIARYLLSEHKLSSDPEVVEKKVKLQQLKLVLEMYGRFSGINRKVQFKYQPSGHPKRSSSEDDDIPREPSLVLIVKWGGELTPAGRIQAEDLGKAFRTLYPGGQGQFETPGLGFLRLHSTFRHDLKIYASDEGRVQMTAAAFTKGLLALEGELTPILVQMVKSANTNGLLDNEGESSKYQHIVKQRLMEMLNQDREFTEEDHMKLAPSEGISLKNALNFIKNPKKMCDSVHGMVKEITAKIRTLKMELKNRATDLDGRKDMKLYHGESWELLTRRWAKLEKDFKMKNTRYDISKIPDIYDCIKYDLQHNMKTLNYDRADELFTCSKALADIVIPQEYGITVAEKLHISQNFCTPLLRKIHSDLQQCFEPTEDDDTTRLNSEYSKGVSSPGRFVRTRLYFTSESHIHSLLTILRYGGLFGKKDDQWNRAMEFLSATTELNYMTQLVIMMFEDSSKDPASDERFHIELHFSPGAYTSCKTNANYPLGTGYRTHSNHQSSKGKHSPSKKVPSIVKDPVPVVMKLGPKLDVGSAVIPESTEELDEAEIFEHGSTAVSPVAEAAGEEKKNNICSPKKVPATRSPDPDVPEWDWGDDSTDTKQVTNKAEPETISSVSKDADTSKDAAISVIPVSCPIEIKPPKLDKSSQTKSATETGKSQSFEEKRSRSLEDKQDSKDSTALLERHYLTIHLPVGSDRYRHSHSFSSLFYLNPSAFKAFERFSMVPSLRPLETLHNALTLKDMDNFLARATTLKFSTPVSSPPYCPSTPMVSPRPAGLHDSLTMPTAAKVAQSLPSSSSSSAGPSSPTSVSMPVDILNKLHLYIMDNQGGGTGLEVESDQTPSSTRHSGSEAEPSSTSRKTSDSEPSELSQQTSESDPEPTSVGCQTELIKHAPKSESSQTDISPPLSCQTNVTQTEPTYDSCQTNTIQSLSTLSQRTVERESQKPSAVHSASEVEVHISLNHQSSESLSGSSTFDQQISEPQIGLSSAGEEVLLEQGKFCVASQRTSGTQQPESRSVGQQVPESCTVGQQAPETLIESCSDRQQASESQTELCSVSCETLCPDSTSHDDHILESAKESVSKSNGQGSSEPIASQTSITEDRGNL